MANKLPTFGAGNAAVFDESIIDNESSLKDTGFQSNTTIKSAEMNTYMRMLINGMSGLIDAVYQEGVTSGDITAASTAEEVKAYIKAGVTQIAKTTKVDNAAHADRATNVDNIVNEDNDNNPNVAFSIGDKHFQKVVQNVAHATSADELASGQEGSPTAPIYIDENGHPKQCDSTIANNTYGKAAAADRLTTARRIGCSGDAIGSELFDGTGDCEIVLNVKKAAALDSVNVGSFTRPVFFNTQGKPQQCNTVLGNDISGNASTATKLANGRTIQLQGDISGAASFDGSSDVSINTSIVNAKSTQMVDSDSATLNVGSRHSPVYFAQGVPVIANMCEKVYTTTVRCDPNATLEIKISNESFIGICEIDYNAYRLQQICFFINGYFYNTMRFSYGHNSSSAPSTEYIFYVNNSGYGTDISSVAIRNNVAESYNAGEMTINIYKLLKIDSNI